MSFDGPRLGGRYVLGPRIGRGSQAETFLAQDQRRDAIGPNDDATLVVVKRLVPRGTWKGFELFEREAKVLSQLRHPGIPRFHASFEEPPGTFNLVMERMRGDTLRELVQSRRLSELELRDILVRGLEILDYLHTRSPPVVHRDIKPSNLILSPDGKLALVDFGGVLDGAREQGGSTVVGTFGYMAPEQLHGQVLPATDLYALGATIVALAGGIEPEDVPRKGLRMDLERHLPSLDPQLRATLLAMTEPDPSARPARARDVMMLLSKGKGKRTALPEPESARALATRGEVLPARRLFSGLAEPWATLLRLTVLGFGAGGWATMAGLRLSSLITFTVAAALLFPLRRTVQGAGRELDSMLTEGQSGFSDLMKLAMKRTEANDEQAGKERKR